MSVSVQLSTLLMVSCCLSSTTATQPTVDSDQMREFNVEQLINGQPESVVQTNDEENSEIPPEIMAQILRKQNLEEQYNYERPPILQTVDEDQESKYHIGKYHHGVIETPPIFIKNLMPIHYYLKRCRNRPIRIDSSSWMHLLDNNMKYRQPDLIDQGLRDGEIAMRPEIPELQPHHRMLKVYGHARYKGPIDFQARKMPVGTKPGYINYNIDSRRHNRARWTRGYYGRWYKGQNGGQFRYTRRDVSRTPRLVEDEYEFAIKRFGAQKDATAANQIAAVVRIEDDAEPAEAVADPDSTEAPPAAEKTKPQDAGANAVDEYEIPYEDMTRGQRLTAFLKYPFREIRDIAGDLKHRFQEYRRKRNAKRKRRWARRRARHSKGKKNRGIKPSARIFTNTTEKPGYNVLKVNNSNEYPSNINLTTRKLATASLFEIPERRLMVVNLPTAGLPNVNVQNAANKWYQAYLRMKYARALKQTRANIAQAQAYNIVNAQPSWEQIQIQPNVIIAQE